MDELRYPAVRETVHHCVLPNGLNIYVNVKPEYGKQFAFFAARCGGMDLHFRGEDGSLMDMPAGTAHFLEHMAFDTGDGGAIHRMTARGVDPNAYTTASMTGYYFETVQDFEENLFDLLTLVSRPSFTQDNVDKERGIIVQEIRMEEDDPDSVVYERLMEAMYVRHPVRVRILGSAESISEITPELLEQCHRAFYRPGNMVLCAAGNIDPQRVADIARKALPEGKSSILQADWGQLEPDRVDRFLVERIMPVSIPLFEIGFKGTPAPKGGQLRQRLLAGLVCDVLFGASAPLYSRLYEQGLINGSFDSGYDDAPGCACLVAGGESRDPERVLDEVLREAVRLGREGIDPDLWERLKKAAYGGMVRQLNSLENICVELAQSHFDGEEFFRFPESFQSIERADGEAMLRQWCTRDRVSLSVIRPEE